MMFPNTTADVDQGGTSAELLKGLHYPQLESVFGAHPFVASATAPTATLGDEAVYMSTLFDPILFNQVPEYRPGYVSRMVRDREVETRRSTQFDIPETLGVSAKLADHHLYCRLNEFESFRFVNVQFI